MDHSLCNVKKSGRRIIHRAGNAKCYIAPKCCKLLYVFLKKIAFEDDTEF